MILRVLFYGDSNTWGYRPGGGRLPPNRRYTTMVTRQALNVLPLVDGLNGRCSAWESPVFPKELLGGATLAPALLAHGPLNGLVIMLGTNDVMPPLNLPAAAICANLLRMIKTARALCGQDLNILLVSPPPMAECALQDLVQDYGADREVLCQDLAAPMERLARKAGTFFLNGGSILAAMDARDGYHMAEVGHLRLGLAIGQLLRSLDWRQS